MNTEKYFFFYYRNRVKVTTLITEKENILRSRTYWTERLLILQFSNAVVRLAESQKRHWQSTSAMYVANQFITY